jgi:hypothetical protein
VTRVVNKKISLDEQNKDELNFLLLFDVWLRANSMDMVALNA